MPGNDINREMLDSPAKKVGENKDLNQHYEKGIEYTPKITQNAPAVFKFNVPGYKLKKEFPVPKKGA